MGAHQAEGVLLLLPAAASAAVLATSPASARLCFACRYVSLVVV
jgi:hypothetical protein